MIGIKVLLRFKWDFESQNLIEIPKCLETMPADSLIKLDKSVTHQIMFVVFHPYWFLLCIIFESNYILFYSVILIVSLCIKLLSYDI